MTRARDLAKGTFSGDLTVDTNTLVVDSANNRVGVGTASPRVKLDLRSDAVIAAPTPLANAVTSGVFAIGDSVGSVVGLQLNGSSYDTYIQSRNMGAGSAAYNLLLQPLGGNVGIGTSSPDAKLNIVGATGNQLRLSTSETEHYAIGRNDSTGHLDFYASQPSYTGYTFGGVDGERMRIDSSGRLLVNTTVALGSAKLVVEADTLTANPMTVSNSRSSAATDYSILFYRNGSIVGSVQTSLSATSYVTSSDYRLKTDAQPMTGASARVQALKPVNFEWISSGERVDGFLAHEAQAVVPEAVTGTKDAMRDEEYEVTAAVLDADGMVVTEAVMGTRSVPDMQGIDQSKLVPLLTAALQEALNKIEAMETRLAALEAN
jgi:hypothetical protein